MASWLDEAVPADQAAPAPTGSWLNEAVPADDQDVTEMPLAVAERIPGEDAWVMRPPRPGEKPNARNSIVPMDRRWVTGLKNVWRIEPEAWVPAPPPDTEKSDQRVLLDATAFTGTLPQPTPEELDRVQAEGLAGPENAAATVLVNKLAGVPGWSEGNTSHRRLAMKQLGLDVDQRLWFGRFDAHEQAAILGWALSNPGKQLSMAEAETLAASITAKRTLGPTIRQRQMLAESQRGRAAMPSEEQAKAELEGEYLGHFDTLLERGYSSIGAWRTLREKYPWQDWTPDLATHGAVARSRIVTERVGTYPLTKEEQERLDAAHAQVQQEWKAQQPDRPPLTAEQVNRVLQARFQPKKAYVPPTGTRVPGESLGRTGGTYERVWGGWRRVE